MEEKNIIFSSMVREGCMEEVQFQKMPRGHRGKSSLGTANLWPPGESIQGMLVELGSQRGRRGVTAVEGGKRWECRCCGHCEKHDFHS